MEKLERLYEGKAKILHKTSDPDLCKIFALPS